MIFFHQFNPIFYNHLRGFQDDNTIGKDKIVHYGRFYNIRDETKSSTLFDRSFDMNPLLPLGMLFIIGTIIFIIFVFRRWPGLIAGIIAGALTSLSFYLTLLALKEQKPTYE